MDSELEHPSVHPSTLLVQIWRAHEVHLHTRGRPSPSPLSYHQAGKMSARNSTKQQLGDHGTLCVGHCSGHLMYIISFNPHTTLCMGIMIILIL